MSENAREEIMAAAKLAAQAHGYAGLNYRDLAKVVGIKPASIYYYFPAKADLATAVAKRYHEDDAAYLESLLRDTEPPKALRRYPETFRWALSNDNRMCMASFLFAETDDLPEQVRAEVQEFANVNVAWLKKVLVAAKIVPGREAERRAQAIYAAVAGAQLVARSRKDVTVYDKLIEGYRAAGLLV